MIVRNYNSKQDYDDVAKWWIAQDWPALPEDILPSTGFIVQNNNVKLAATWIIKTNCPIYIMEWTVGNPEVDWNERATALELVTDAACDWAKQDGAKQVFTMTKNDRFIKKLVNYNGFIKADSGMTHLIRSL